MIIDSLKSTFRKSGPGMLFAAQSVGTSHLVQATRAGGEYGFSLTILVIVACLIKYPAFRFSIDYVNATGKSLLDNYLKRGNFIFVLFVVSLLVDMFVATAAVTLVTAGLLSVVFGVDANTQYLAVGLLVAFSTMLIVGGYKIFELVTKAFVLVFFSLAIIATVMAWLKLPGLSIDLLPPVVMENATILFIVAVAGWMPTSVTASVYLSEWRAKKLALNAGQDDDRHASNIDFDVGYWGTAILALFFLSLGAILVFPTGESTQLSAVGFSKLLFSIFTNALGDWTLPIIALAAISVMASTSLSLLDACPRVGMRLLNKVVNVSRGYGIVLITQVVGSTVVLLFFMKSFTSLIDLATGLAFTTAPFIAYLNHTAMFSSDVSDEYQASKFLYFWSLFSIIVMAVFALAYVYIRFIQ